MIDAPQIALHPARSTRISLLGIFACAGFTVIGALSLARYFPRVANLQTIVSWQYAFLALIVIAACISIIRRIRSRLFWESLFTITVFLGVWYLLLLILPMGAALMIASALTLGEIFFRNVAIHDLLYLLGAAGVAINFAGWLPPEVLIAILVVMTLYDMVAVAPGGPIEELARTLVSKGIIPGFIVVSRAADFFRPMDDVIRTDAALLGAGDVILPMCLIARASFAGAWEGSLVLVGLLIGAFMLSRKPATHPRAALPALAVGATVPFLILRLLAKV